MIRKAIWLLLILILSGCSILPIDPNIFKTQQTCPTCPAAYPSVPPIVVPCDTQVCPTCPPVTTPLPPTATKQSPTVILTSTVILSPTITVTTSTTSDITQTVTSTETTPFTPTQVYKPYKIQPNSPVYMQNFAHLDKVCNWMGVAGQAFDVSGQPVKNLVVVIEGFLNNQPIDMVDLTGLRTSYGPGGYEIVLSDGVISSSDSLFITLYSLNGEDLSLPVVFNTYADCNKNLIVINFQQQSTQ